MATAQQPDFINPTTNTVPPSMFDGRGNPIDPGNTVVPAGPGSPPADPTNPSGPTDPSTVPTNPGTAKPSKPWPIPTDPTGTNPSPGPTNPTTPIDKTSAPSPPAGGSSPTNNPAPPAGGGGGTGVDPNDPMGLGGTVPVADTSSVGVPDSGTSTAANAQQDVWNVTPDQTVAGQMQKLLNRDSPFFELARNRAVRRMLSSGGKNSAMAEGFGEIAAMDQAFKMSFADAATYAKSAEFNAAMANQFSLAEQRFIHNATLSDQNFKQAGVLQTQRIAAQFEAIRMDFKGRDVLLKQQLATSLATAQIAAGAAIAAAGIAAKSRLDVTNLQFDRQTKMEGQMQISNYFTNGMAQVVADVNAAGLDPAAARAAMESGTNWLISQLPIIQGIWATQTPTTGGPGG